MHNEPIVILGGSFDPIHNGHMAIVHHLQQLGFKKVILLPCGQPALKSACQASPSERLDMLRLAIGNEKNIEIDTRELERSGPSFAIDTLKTFRTQTDSNTSIIFVIGQDAFANYMKWHQWQHILEICHIINHQRPNLALKYPETLKDYISTHESLSVDTLKQKPNGYIYSMDFGDFPYASSDIRESIKNNLDVEGLNPKVYAFIKEKRLYR